MGFGNDQFGASQDFGNFNQQNFQQAPQTQQFPLQANQNNFNKQGATPNNFNFQGNQVSANPQGRLSVAGAGQIQPPVGQSNNNTQKGSQKGKFQNYQEFSQIDQPQQSANLKSPIDVRVSQNLKAEQRGSGGKILPSVEHKERVNSMRGDLNK